jgi:hypothetical protein
MVAGAKVLRSAAELSFPPTMRHEIASDAFRITGSADRGAVICAEPSSSVTRTLRSDSTGRKKLLV